MKAQRSITSFFRKQDKPEELASTAAAVKKQKLSNDADSSVNSGDEKLSPQVVSKRRRAVIESDSSSASECEDSSAVERTVADSEKDTVNTVNTTEQSDSEPNNNATDKHRSNKSTSPSNKKAKSGSAVSSGKASGDMKKPSENKSHDENSYDPSKSRYHPVDDAVWNVHQSVPYLALARTLSLIEETSGRLKIIELLANYFRSVIVLSPQDLLSSVYLCLNQLAPAYHGIELGVGETVITRALAQATGRTVDKIKRDVAELGDLGLVAESSKSHQRVMFQPAPLTVAAVFKTLKDIALMSGHAVMNKKMAKMQSLLVSCRHCETRFIVRSLTGKLRVGLAEQSVLQALGQACAMTPPSSTLPLQHANRLSSKSTAESKEAVDKAALLIKTAYCQCPTYDEIVPVLLEHGVESLPQRCCIRPGVPLKPMLAHPTKGVSEVLSRFEDAQFTCEYKYDGERAQIHLLQDGSVCVYSRNQENNTTKYPDIVQRFRKCLSDDIKSCILDTEAVAWDSEKQQILPFQVLSTRKRKDAGSSEIKIQVQVFVFDLLYLNGESLVEQPFETRRHKLRTHFHPVEGEFAFAKSMDSNNVEDIAEFLDESVKGNCEGLMVKTLQKDATYEIAKRSRNWLKLKKDYLEGVGDTIDAVVIGGFLGKGKRAGAYGGFLLACYDPENEEFQSMCKIGTGFSDEDLQKHTAFFKQHVIDSPKSYYSWSLKPDHWFEAVQVWEIKCADLSISPVHKAAVGLVDMERGISLRFPRFLRIRDDKKAEEATSASQIADMYNSQDQVKNQGATGGNDGFY